MKKKDFQDSKNKTIADLERDLAHHREKLNSLRWDLAQGKVKNIREMRRLKKTIAQILTLIKLKK